MKDSPYSCQIKDGQIVISVGLETLSKSVRIPAYCVINDFEGFARDIYECLITEQDEGSTPVLTLFDAMADKAIDEGSFNVEDSGGN